VPATEARAVAVNKELRGNPLASRGANIAGISARMYDIVVKVVRPEMISVFRLCRCTEKPTSANIFSFILK